jgi:FKBP-type peptidyl-prolyl cis-trans isomerase FklB
MKFKSSILAGVFALSILVSCKNQESMTNDKKTLETTVEKASYGIGVNIAQNMKSQGLDSLDVNLIAQAMKTVFTNGELLLTAEESNQIIQDYMMGMQAKKAEGSIKAGQEFLATNGKREGVTTTASGLQYEVMKEGNGPKPTLESKVTTHYHGTLIDGTVFDSSVERGQPATFPVSGVIAGWTEALQLMPVGSKWKLFVPSNLAYGERGAGGQIGPHSTLIFEVELLSIDK